MEFAEELEASLESMEVEPGVVADDEGEMLVEEEDDEAIADDEEDEDVASLEDDKEDQTREVEDSSWLRLAAHEDAVYAVCLRRVGAKLVCVTGGGDDVARLSVAGETEEITLRGHADSVTCASLSRSGELVATGSYDGTVRIWNLGGNLERALEGPGEIEWLTWHPRGDVVLAGSQDSTTWMWLATTGECLRVFAGHDGSVTCGLFTLDGNWVLTGSADSTARLWSPKKGTCRKSFPCGGAVVSLVSHPTDSDLLLAAAEDGTARVLHRKLEKEVAVLGGAVATRSTGDEHSAHETAVVTAAGFLQGLTWAATGGLDGACKVWDYSTGALRQDVSAGGAVVALCCHPRQPRFYVATAQPRILNIDARTGQTLLELSGFTAPVLALDVDAPENDEAEFVLAAGDDRQPRLFRVAVFNDQGAYRLVNTPR